MFPSKDPTVRVASWHNRKVLELSGKNKISGVAIKAALKAFPGLEFVDAVTGQTTTVAEVKKAGGHQMTVRFNQDRDFAIIKV